MKPNLLSMMNRGQSLVLRRGLRGEEKEGFREIVARLNATISAAPVTYEQDGRGDGAIVHFHYFLNGSDWWIAELDVNAGQGQAFGLVCLNGWTDSAELGYVSIPEIVAGGAELDFYWTPKTLGEVRAELEER